MTQVERVELHEVSVPLRSPFKGARVTVTERRVILVRLVAGGAGGWGECGPVPGYSADDLDSAWEALAAAAPRLVGEAPTLAPPAGLTLTAAAAVSQAAADLAARLAGRPLWRTMGGASGRVTAGASVGLTDDPAALVARVGREVAAGYRHVKLKIRPGQDRMPLATVREAFPELSLAADANATYTAADTGTLAALDDLGLDYLEQPLPAADIAGHVRLARELATAIVLDESAAVPGWEEALAGTGAGVGVTVKPGRLPWPDIVATAALDGPDHRFRIGGMLELGIGRAHAAAAATLPGYSLPTDLSPTSRYLLADVAGGMPLADGRLVLSERPGVGVDVDPDRLAAATRRKLIVLG